MKIPAPHSSAGHSRLNLWNLPLKGKVRQRKNKRNKKKRRKEKRKEKKREKKRKDQKGERAKRELGVGVGSWELG